MKTIDSDPDKLTVETGNHLNSIPSSDETLVAVINPTTEVATDDTQDKRIKALNEISRLDQELGRYDEQT